VYVVLTPVINIFVKSKLSRSMLLPYYLCKLNIHEWSNFVDSRRLGSAIARVRLRVRLRGLALAVLGPLELDL